MPSRHFTINDFPHGTPDRERFELRETQLPALFAGGNTGKMLVRL